MMKAAVAKMTRENSIGAKCPFSSPRPIATMTSQVRFLRMKAKTACIGDLRSVACRAQARAGEL